jgi:hypothetical protein
LLDAPRIEPIAELSDTEPADVTLEIEILLDELFAL